MGQSSGVGKRNSTQPSLAWTVYECSGRRNKLTYTEDCRARPYGLTGVSKFERGYDYQQVPAFFRYTNYHFEVEAV